MAEEARSLDRPTEPDPVPDYVLRPPPAPMSRPSTRGMPAVVVPRPAGPEPPTASRRRPRRLLSPSAGPRRGRRTARARVATLDAAPRRPPWCAGSSAARPSFSAFSSRPAGRGCPTEGGARLLDRSTPRKASGPLVDPPRGRACARAGPLAPRAACRGLRPPAGERAWRRGRRRRTGRREPHDRSRQVRALLRGGHGGDRSLDRGAPRGRRARSAGGADRGHLADLARADRRGAALPPRAAGRRRRGRRSPRAHERHWRWGSRSPPRIDRTKRCSPGSTRLRGRAKGTTNGRRGRA